MVQASTKGTRESAWLPRALRWALPVCASVAVMAGCKILTNLGILHGDLEVRVLVTASDPYSADFSNARAMENGGSFSMGEFNRYTDGYRYVAVMLFNTGNGVIEFEADVTVEVESDLTDTDGTPVFLSTSSYDSQLWPGGVSIRPGSMGNYRAWLLEQNRFVSAGQKRATFRILEGDTEILAFTVTATYASEKGQVRVRMRDLTDVEVDAYQATFLYAGGSRVGWTSGRVLIAGTSEADFTQYTPPGMASQVGYPNGEYTLIVHVDNDDDGVRDVAEYGYMTTFDLAGDRLVAIGQDEWEEMVAEEVTAGVENAPEGSTLVCVWCLPGGGLESWQGLSAGVFAAGASTTTINTTIVPGTYDLYCYVDLDGSTGLASTVPTWQDEGEPELLVQGVVVTGAGTAVTGTFVPALEPQLDTSIGFLVDFYTTYVLTVFTAIFAADEETDPDTFFATLTSADDADFGGTATVTIYTDPDTGDATTTIVCEQFTAGLGTFYTTTTPHVVIQTDTAGNGSWSGRVDATGAHTGYIITDGVDIIDGGGNMLGIWNVSGVEYTHAELVAAME